MDICSFYKKYSLLLFIFISVNYIQLTNIVHEGTHIFYVFKLFIHCSNIFARFLHLFYSLFLFCVRYSFRVRIFFFFTIYVNVLFNDNFYINLHFILCFIFRWWNNLHVFGLLLLSLIQVILQYNVNFLNVHYSDRSCLIRFSILSSYCHVRFIK